MPTTIAGKVEMISNLAHKLPLVAESLGIAPDEVQGVQEDSAYLSFALTAKNLHMLKAEEWVTHALLAQNGSGVNPMPKAIQLGPAPKVVPAGALNRVSDMVVRMKRHGNYTEAIGRDLGVVGPEKRVDLGEIRPTLDVRLESGRPFLTWSKGPAQSAEIRVDYGTGRTRREAPAFGCYLHTRCIGETIISIR